jgi:hypothetical protein
VIIEKEEEKKKKKENWLIALKLEIQIKQN